MIFIETGTNDIILTLSENSTIQNAYYLFKFISEFDLTETPIYFITPNISLSTGRYDHFILEMNTTGSTSGGTDIPLYLESGQWDYSVYEGSSYSIDPNDFTRLIETGKMVVSTILYNTELNSVYQ